MINSSFCFILNEKALIYLNNKELRLDLIFPLDMINSVNVLSL